jgi:uncharacterized protein (TIGR03067 family)
MTFKLDAAKKPRAIDMADEMALPGVYEVTGDTLKMCYDASGKTRPTKLASEEGTVMVFVVFKREKK